MWALAGPLKHGGLALDHRGHSAAAIVAIIDGLVGRVKVVVQVVYISADVHKMNEPIGFKHQFTSNKHRRPERQTPWRVGEEEEEEEGGQC